MTTMRPRAFAAGDAGYHNAALGTAGAAIAIPTGAQGAWVSVSAGCYIGIRDSATIGTLNDTRYGSIRATAQPIPIQRTALGGDEDFLIIAPWTGTAEVAVAFF